MIRAAAACALLWVWPATLCALDLPAGARLLAERITPLGGYALPLGPFDGNGVPSREVEGRIERRSWRIDSGAATPLQMMAPLRAQLLAEGYELVFECPARECGGFDFRFGTEVIPAPHMHVDIGNYRFLSATRGAGEALSLLVSRSRNSAYIQMIRVGPTGPGVQGQPERETEPDAGAGQPSDSAQTPEAAAAEQPSGTLVTALLHRGHVVLTDLEFGTGVNALGAGPYASLGLIAEFLAAHPGYRIVLVGHTDSVGTLENNIALSKRRAETVRARMISDYGVAPDRIGAEGMGYLAPVASNLTREGREQNRRVEAILLPAE